MNPKSKLKKTIHQIEDELEIDSTVEDIVDSILDIFEGDGDNQEEDDTVFQDDDDDPPFDDDFGAGDSGGGGSSSDW